MRFDSRLLVTVSVGVVLAAGQGRGQQAPTSPGTPKRPAAAAHGPVVPGLPVAIAVEAESLIATAQVSYQAPPPIRQDMSGFGTAWSGNAQLFWRPPAPVDEPTRNWPNVRLFPSVAAAGTYAVALVYTQAPDFGNARVFVRGQSRGDTAGYATTVRTARMDLGEIALPAGTFEVLLTVFGKAPQSSGFAIGLDRLVFKRR